MEFSGPCPVSLRRPARNGVGLRCQPMNDDAGEYNYELATGSTISVNAESDNIDAAVKVIDFLISYSGSPILDPCFRKRLRRMDGACACPSLPKDFPADTDERVVAYFADFADVTGEGRIGYTTWTPSGLRPLMFNCGKQSRTFG